MTRRLTLRKVQRAANALQDLLDCDDLPDVKSDPEVNQRFGWAREDIERCLVERVLPLEQLFDDD